MATLSLKNINKIYDNNVQAVFDFNLEIADKEFIVFVGPSGCGKSTTLRMIAGLEDITSGELYIGGSLMNNIEPKDRDIAMVFQNYALYPHMSVYDNMAFSLKLRKFAMPIYEKDDVIEDLNNENNALFKKVKEIDKKFKKNQNDLSLLEPRAELFKEIYSNLEKIKSIRKQVVGINQYQIAKHEKAINELKNEISKMETSEKRYESNGKIDEMNIVKKGLEERYNLLDKMEKELEYFKYNETPLTKLRKMTAKEIEVEVNKVAGNIDLTKYLFRKPAALSGGQRQRVALGRAIVRKPKVFLMDEPLSNLDAKLRVQTRAEISKIHKKVGATTIYVTHDQTEAMTMADRIVIMKDGYIQQIGSPDEVYNDPANIFVGGFIGSPSMNFIEGIYQKGEFVFASKETQIEENKEKSTYGDFKIKIPNKYKTFLEAYEGKTIVMGVRPENIHLQGSKLNENPSEKINLLCDFSELLGNELILYTYPNEQSLVLKTEAKNNIKSRSQIDVCFDLDKLYFFDIETSNRIK